MRKLTEAQFTQAVYRNYHGETISSIANDFGIGISTLSELRDRHREQWDQIRDKIIDADIAHLKSTEIKTSDLETRNLMTHLFCYLTQLTPYNEVLTAVCEKANCTKDEAETYIKLFEARFLVRFPRCEPTSPPKNT